MNKTHNCQNIITQFNYTCIASEEIKYKQIIFSNFFTNHFHLEKKNKLLVKWGQKNVPLENIYDKTCQ